MTKFWQQFPGGRVQVQIGEVKVASNISISELILKLIVLLF